ncbi:MAG: ribokinase [Chloroflexi bacterium]|nr:ribokinase [Chloroflexota bacterium]
MHEPSVRDAGAGTGQILVVGSVNTDLVVRAERIPRPGETVQGSAFLIGGGGKGANQAVAAARLGGSVRFVGRVGPDAFGQTRRAELLRAGIDVQDLGSATEPTGVALIVVDAHGENAIATAPGANHALAPEDLAAHESAFASVAICLLQMELQMTTVKAAARRARRAGARVILNPAPIACPLQDDLIEAVDVLVPNEREAATLLGVASEERSALEDAARAFAAKYRRTMIVTLGSAGALIVEAEGSHHVPAPRVTVTDTTGAGDAFCGALAVAMAEGLAIVAAVRFACAAGAMAVTKRGAHEAMPWRDDIDALLREHPA